MGRVVHQRASSVPKENLGPKAAGLGYAEASTGSFGVGQREVSRGKLQLGFCQLSSLTEKATEALFLSLSFAGLFDSSFFSFASSLYG